MYTKHVLLGLLAVCLMTAQALVFSAPVGDSGPEFWVDGPLGVYPAPGNAPLNVDASVDHLGTQVFVWDNKPLGQTGTEVFLRRFTPDGDALANPVQVNTWVDNNQLYPRVAITTTGAFLVIWQSFEPPEPGVNSYRIVIRSQAYGPDGQPTGSEQLVSTIQTMIATDASADVAALAGGGFIVVWQSNQSVNQADSSTTIQGRRVGADGVPVGAQFQVNSLVSSTQEGYSAVAALDDGGFFVVWSRPQIHGRRFTANATPVGNDFQINTYMSARSRIGTDVAVNDDGRLMVVWTDSEEGLTKTEIRGRMYSPNLVALGPDVRINDYETDSQDEPKVGNYGEQGFFVVWTSTGSAGPDIAPRSIEGRVINGPNSFSGSQFLVNQYTPTTQKNPAIGGRDGLLAIAWFSGSNAQVNINVIVGQYWNPCGIFCNSFE